MDKQQFDALIAGLTRVEKAIKENTRAVNQAANRK